MYQYNQVLIMSQSVTLMSHIRQLLHTQYYKTYQFQPPHSVPVISCLHVNNTDRIDGVEQESMAD